MQDIRLFATDLDATLLNDAGQLPDTFIATAQELAFLGIHPVIASGRSLHTVQAMFPDLAHHASFICDNGALVYSHGRVISLSEIAPRHYQAMCRAIQNCGGVPVVCGPGSAYIDHQDIKHRSALAKSFAKISIAGDITQLTAPAEKISAFFPEGHTDAQATAIKTAFGRDYTVVVAGTQWVDLMNRGVNKGTALRALGHTTGIAPENMLAFGNTDNDREMLQLVRYSYIVENATPGMTDVARFRTASCNDEGVMQVLDQLLMCKQRDTQQLMRWATGR